MFLHLYNIREPRILNILVSLWKIIYVLNNLKIINAHGSCFGRKQSKIVETSCLKPYRAESSLYIWLTLSKAYRDLIFWLQTTREAIKRLLNHWVCSNMYKKHVKTNRYFLDVIFYVMCSQFNKILCGLFTLSMVKVLLGKIKWCIMFSDTKW